MISVIEDKALLTSRLLYEIHEVSLKVNGDNWDKSEYIPRDTFNEFERICFKYLVTQGFILIGSAINSVYFPLEGYIRFDFKCKPNARP